MPDFLPCGAFGIGDAVKISDPESQYHNMLCCIIDAKITLTLPRVPTYGDRERELHWFDQMPDGSHQEDPKLRQRYGLEILGHGSVYWFYPKQLQLVERGHLWNKLLEQKCTK